MSQQLRRHRQRAHRALSARPEPGWTRQPTLKPVDDQCITCGSNNVVEAGTDQPSMVQGRNHLHYVTLHGCVDCHERWVVKADT